ncbi:unnamed protein product [Rhodiola kirilowii]
MKSLNSIGLGLSLTFGCLLLALVGEIYYLLWWKRRSWNRGITEDDCCSNTATTNSSAREFIYMFCCKKFSNTQPLSRTVSLTVADRFQQQNENDNNNRSNKDLLLLKSDEGVHDMTGPPRLLFTIKEETIEDLESEDGRVSSSARSLSYQLETPYLTPLSSPSMFTPPLTPLNSSYTHLGFNPLFESSSDAELRRLKASPPPKFKFLQEAEGKFQRRRMMELDMDQFNNGCAQNPVRSKRVDRDESLITIIVAKGSRAHRS